MVCHYFHRFVALVAVFVWILAAKGQEDAEDSPHRPGLVATYSAAVQSVVRTDEIVAFDWQDAACDSRLPAGEFSANWHGRLWAQGAGVYRLACFAQGEVELKLAGKTVISGRATQPQWLESEPLTLEFDYHPLELTFRKTQPTAQCSLFWSGPDFRLEPIPARFLLHDRDSRRADVAPAIDFQRGRQLAAALRCAACHQDPAASHSPAPALDRLSGNIHQPWLVEWLTSHTANDSKASPRRMPDLGINRQEAEAIAAWLLREPPEKAEPKKFEQKEAKAAKDDSKAKKSKKGKADEQPRPSAEAGERLILTRGCLACHKLGEYGESGLFGGGDLTELASKRPADFLVRWLEDPAAINRHHRMPQFKLTPDEITSLSLWATQRRRSAIVLRAD
jgi:mono/diheme cytochrome c family protein